MIPLWRRRWYLCCCLSRYSARRRVASWVPTSVLQWESWFGISDLVDLWVIKIKKSMILCARSTSRSREQNTKRRSRSENMWKVCLFYSHNKKIAWLSNVADTCFEKFTKRAKVCGLFFLFLFLGADWLDRETQIARNLTKIKKEKSFQSWTVSRDLKVWSL